MNISTNIDLEWVKVIANGKTIEVLKYPATNSQYTKFIENGGYTKKEFWSDDGWKWKEAFKFFEPSYWMEEGYSEPNLPVTGVSLWEAEAFANWIGGRIPFEPEWCDICTGRNGYLYPWGNEFPTNEHCNLAFFGKFSESKRIAVNKFEMGCSVDGVFDLIGNVSEWCFLENVQLADNNGNVKAVLKGGCCWHTPLAVDCNFRDEVLANTRDNQTGIRVLRDLVNPIHATKKSLQLPSIKRYASDAAKSHHKPLLRPTAVFRQEGIPEQKFFDNWSLKITGLVENELCLTLDDLKSDFKVINKKGLFVCVCRWADFNVIQGVLVKDVIEKAGIKNISDELYLVQKSIPSNNKQFITSVSVKQAIEHEALLCFSMDNQPLTIELGAPLRYIDFSLYGYKQVKALNEIEITSKRVIGWWEGKQQYDVNGTIQSGHATLVGDYPVKIEI